MISVLFNHNPEKWIGRMDENGVVTLREGVNLTREIIFETFGWIGVEWLELEYVGESVIVRKFRILEWSVPPNRPILDKKQ